MHAMNNVQNYDSIHLATYTCKYCVCMAATANPHSSGGRILVSFRYLFKIST